MGITTTKSANVTCTSIWDFLCLRLAAHDIYSLTLSLAMETQSQKQAHVSLLAQFLTSYPFRDVLLLASLDSAAGTTEDHLFDPLQVLFPPAASSDYSKQQPTSTVSESETDTLKQRLSRIPEYIPPSPSESYTMPNKSSTSSYPPFLPNGGLTRRLLLTLHQQSNPAPPSHATLVYWCTEADNRDDALRFAGVVTYALGIRTSAPSTFILPLWLFFPATWFARFQATACSCLCSITDRLYIYLGANSGRTGKTFTATELGWVVWFSNGVESDGEWRSGYLRIIIYIRMYARLPFIRYEIVRSASLNAYHPGSADRTKSENATDRRVLHVAEPGADMRILREA